MLGSLIFSIYRSATSLASLAIPWWLRRRVAKGKELAGRLDERFGRSSISKPVDIWCHAASVGETTSILPLLSALAASGQSIVLTTGTVASEALVRNRLPANVCHQFAPLDHMPWIHTFLDAWRPRLALRVDSELWPNTLSALSARSIPVVQVNARISAKAAHNWQCFPTVARTIFSKFTLVLAQSEDDRARFAQLGAPQSLYCGNLKLDTPDLPFIADHWQSFKVQIGTRPVWLAASIHPGEDNVLAAAHRIVCDQFPDALLIIVPRHAERAPAIRNTLQASGFQVAQRSAGQELTQSHNVYLADTMGELGLFYRLCKIVFIGKTFAVGGGQNPAEAAQLGCAMLWGPDMSNFTSLAQDLIKAHAAKVIVLPEHLGPSIAELLTQPDTVANMGVAGQRYAQSSRGALQRVLEALAPYLSARAIR